MDVFDEVTAHPIEFEHCSGDPKHTQESVDSVDTKGNIHALQSTFETQHDQDIDLQEIMRNPITFLSEINGDTMYFHQAMNKEDSADFVEDVVK